MLFVARGVTGVLLLAHGLVHLLYLAADVPEFSYARSWLVPEGARRPLALALVSATVAAFALLALAVWGVPGLSSAWPVLTILAGLVSAALLVLFWHRNLILGLGIDAALITVAVTRPAWADDFLGSS